jgi:hypothetical protein
MSEISNTPEELDILHVESMRERKTGERERGRVFMHVCE